MPKTGRYPKHLKREGMKINTKCMLPYDKITEDEIDRAFEILKDSEKING